MVRVFIRFPHSVIVAAMSGHELRMKIAAA
jgi:hypothetical protein